MPIIKILPIKSENENAMFGLEKASIFYYKKLGYDLCNYTDGGEGTTGYIYNENHRKKISDALRGKKLPERTLEHRENLRKANLGKKLSQETKDKIRKKALLRELNKKKNRQTSL